MNILIVYGTRFGKTRETAETLGSTFRGSLGHTVTVSSYKLSKEVKAGIEKFDLLIAGSSIVAGMWKSGVKRILKKYKNDIKHIALFVTAAGMLYRAEQNGQEKEEGISMAKIKYIEPVKKKYQIKTIMEGVFGGQYGAGEKIKYNNWNREDIINWAKELDGKLK